MISVSFSPPLPHFSLLCSKSDISQSMGNWGVADKWRARKHASFSASPPKPILRRPAVISHSFIEGQCPLPLREESAERCQYYGEELVGFGSNHPNSGFNMEQNKFNRQKYICSCLSNKIYKCSYGKMDSLRGSGQCSK